MAFSSSSQSIHLVQKSILVAECCRPGGTYIEARLDLDGCLGNSDGEFDIGGNEFVGSTQRKSIQLNGTKLTAKLQNVHGVYKKATVDLDYFVANISGQLRPIRPGSGCAVCRNFFDFNEAVSLLDLSGDDRQPGCLRCALLESSIVKYSPPPRDTAHVGEQQLSSYSVTPCLESSHLYLTFSDGNADSKRYELHSTEAHRSILFDVPRAPSLTGNALSSGSLDWLRTELDHCDQDHGRCRPRQAGSLPKRIVEVGAEGRSPRLHATSGEITRYACLSHCWGASKIITATTGTVAQLQREIPWTELDKTYQDAIVFCRHIGIHYIWIDSLCILQDDIEDWKTEAPNMSAYYGGCYICLAATASPDHNGGCRVRPQTPFAYEGMGPDGKQYSVSIREEIPSLMDPVRFPFDQYFPLLTRGWVFQERRLASRYLHFGPAELVLECNTTQVCECGCSSETTSAQITKASMTQPISAFTLREFHAVLEQEWNRMVETYSALELTYVSDRLPAFAGAAAETRARRESEGVAPGAYLHGLWEKTFATDLLWTTHPIATARARDSNVAPSWSWASVMQPIIYPTVSYDQPLCRYIRTTAQESDHVGNISPSANTTIVVKLVDQLLRGKFEIATEQQSHGDEDQETVYFTSDHDAHCRYLLSSTTLTKAATEIFYLMPVARSTVKDIVRWLVLQPERHYNVSYDVALPLFTRIGILDNTMEREIPGTERTVIGTFGFA
ncbi:hypothetical protein LTR27_002559 [Elasticomyces elasticus]|nr:hypothetical protein LTR27_002559 [Elasticomyces elasticus]